MLAPGLPSPWQSDKAVASLYECTSYKAAIRKLVAKASHSGHSPEWLLFHAIHLPLEGQPDDIVGLHEATLILTDRIEPLHDHLYGSIVGDHYDLWHNPLDTAYIEFLHQLQLVRSDSFYRLFAEVYRLRHSHPHYTRALRKTAILFSREPETESLLDYLFHRYLTQTNWSDSGDEEYLSLSIEFLGLREEYHRLAATAERRLRAQRDVQQGSA